MIWGGEFGRTPMGEERTSRPDGTTTSTRFTDLDGRRRHQARHHLRRATDDLGLSVTENPVHVHDLQATILHLLGLDHERLTFRFQGRDFRLTDVHGKVVREILA